MDFANPASPFSKIEEEVKEEVADGNDSGRQDQLAQERPDHPRPSNLKHH